MSDDRTDPTTDPSRDQRTDPVDPLPDLVDPLPGPLGLLSTTPVPLVGADRVRARGRQRARRTQALLAGSGVLLVAALGGGAALLVDHDRSTALVIPAVTATPTPSTPATPSPSPSPSPSVSPSPDPCATMSMPASVTCRVGPDGRSIVEVRPGPTDVNPTLFESPSSDAPAQGAVADLPADTLVTEAALQTSFPSSSTWTRYASGRETKPWNVTPCGSPLGKPSAVFLAGSYQLQDKDGRAVPEGPHLRQQVSRLASPAEASATGQAFRAAVNSCPTATESRTYNGDSTTYPFNVRNDVATQDPLVVARFQTEPAYPWPNYYGVVVVDDLVAVWDYTAGETEDQAAALKVAQLVRKGLCRNTGTC